MAELGYTNTERLRSYSSIFSRSVFSDIMQYDDYSRLNIVRKRYDSPKRNFLTYFDYIRHIYKVLTKEYRCEYVYKNEIINKLLLRTYGTKNTIAFNEFRVKNTIVDFALFNGESKAFEIKTEYDSQRRLQHQMDTYAKLFQKCYIVVPSEMKVEYSKIIPSNVGIIVLTIVNGRIQLKEEKHAQTNRRIDTNVLMHSIRTSEYQNIVKGYFGELPKVSCFDMFNKCKEIIAKIPQKDLHRLFLEEIKKRASNTHLLASFPAEIRQMCLSLQINKKQSALLLQKLNTLITT